VFADKFSGNGHAVALVAKWVNQ